MGILKDFMFEKTDVEKQKEAEEKANATATAGSKPIAKGKDVKFPTNDGTKFPETVGFPTNASVNAGMGNNFTPPPSTLDSNPYMEKTNKMYEEGFVKLNQPGYDFYEFYRAVTKGGVDNPQVYEMALEMGTAMDSDVSKQALTSQADFYISKIVEAHGANSAGGSQKRDGLVQQKQMESANLSSELKNLRTQLESIQTQIGVKEAELSGIDNKYQTQIKEIEYKLIANDVVKDKYVSTINKVKSNIINFLNK